MTSNEKYIIELSKASLFNTEPLLPPKDIDWQFIWDKSQEQNITALIAVSVLKLPKDKHPNNANAWRSAIIQTMSFMSQKNAEFERIITCFKENNITPLCLKGIVIKDLYPIPELRTMGDFDILVEKSQRKSAEAVFESRGYSLKRDTLFTEVDYKSVHGELFTSLESEFKHNPEHWNSVLKQNVYKQNNRLLLTPSYELAFSIVHAAKHLTETGCGIRNLFDVVILLKSHSQKIDLNIVKEVCQSQGHEKIMYYMLTAAEHWYGAAINANIKRTDLKLTEKFIEYLLCYGVFGHSAEGNVLSIQVTKREGNDVSAFRRIFFPPRKMIWQKYQYLKKSPLLLPVAWIHRFINAVFINKYSVKSMIKGIDESISFGNDRDKWLDDLDLK